MIFLFSACVDQVEKGPFEYKSQIIRKFHKDAETVVEYHYGYSVMRGKFCYHLGPNDHPEENVVIYEFLGDTIQDNNKSLYDSLSYNILIRYMKVFSVEKNDTIFLRNKIIERKCLTSEEN